MKKTTKAKPQSDSLMARVRAVEGGIFADMDALTKKHGADVFRIAGQRYFKRQREEAALQEEIAAREAELARLRQKKTGR